MKKSAMTAAVFLLAAGILAGCGKKQADQTALEDKTLPEIVDLIYEQKDPGLAVATTEVDTGDAAVSEAMISAQAYSLVLVRAEDAADTEALAQKMQEGIDPAKWICVQADDLEVSGYGDVAMLIMVSSELEDSVTAEEITEAFRAVCGGQLAFEL